MMQLDTGQPAVKILLVDDEPLIRKGLAMILDAEAGLEICGEADNGHQAIDAARGCLPDVILMDLRMPELDGAEATRLITSQRPQGGRTPAVLVLTTFDTDQHIFAALRAGAAGFLLKSAAPQHLADAVRAIARGEGWLDPVASRALISDYVSRPPGVLPSTELTGALTPREREVLATVAGGYSNGEIAERLCVGQGTVKTHIGRIFTKLGLRDRAQAVALAYESGLVVPRRGSRS